MRPAFRHARTYLTVLALLAAGEESARGQGTIYKAGDGTVTVPQGREVCGTSALSLNDNDSVSYATISASEFAATSFGIAGSAPNPMGRDTSSSTAGPWSVTVLNTSTSVLTVTQVRIDAGTQAIFNAITPVQPATGWTANSTTITWTGSTDVPRYSPLDFVVQIQGRNTSVTAVPVTLTASTSQGLLTATGHVTSERNNNTTPYVSLPFVVNNAQVFSGSVANGGSVVTGQMSTLTVRVKESEAGNTQAIPSGSTLTVTIPPGWSAVSPLASTGFGAAAVTQPTACTAGSILVATNVAILNSSRDFSFTALAPAAQGTVGLYTLQARIANPTLTPPIDTFTDYPIAVTLPPSNVQQAGLMTTSAWVAVPSPMGKNSYTTWGVALANPTYSPVTVKEVRIEALQGDALFRAVTGILPASGWTRVSASLVRWTGTQVIDAHDAFNFICDIQANSNIAINRPIRATVIDTADNVYVNDDGNTTENNGQIETASLYWLASGQPAVYVFGVPSGQSRSFTVAVEERQGASIPSGIPLKIVVPAGWSSVSAATQTGWSAPTIVQPTATVDGSITTGLATSLRSARRTFSFSATAPPNLAQSLFSFPTTFKGGVENSLCEALVQVVDASGGLEVHHLSAPVTDPSINQIDFEVIASSTPDVNASADIFNFGTNSWEPLAAAGLSAAPATLLGSVINNFPDYFDPANRLLARVKSSASDNHRLDEDYAIFIVSDYQLTPSSVAPVSAPQATNRVAMEALQFQADLGSVDLLSLTVTASGTDPVNDVALVRLFPDPECDGVLNPSDTELVPARPLGSGGSVVLDNSPNPAPILSFAASTPVCAVLAYDIAATATVGDTVAARINGAFDLTSSVGPYPFPCSGGFPVASADVLITAQAAPDLSLQKTIDPPIVPPDTGYEVGTSVTYTVTVANGGGADATSVDVHDDLDPQWAPYTGVITPLDGGSLCLPPGCPTPRVVWPQVALLARNGGSRSFRFQATIPLGLADGAVIPNTAASTATEVPSAIGSNPALAPVCAPIVSFDKSLPQGTYSEGDTIEWTMTLANAANCPATSLVVRDTIDATVLDEATLVWTPSTGTYDALSHTYTWPAIPSLAGNGAQTGIYKVAARVKVGAAGLTVCNVGRSMWDQALAELSSSPLSGSCASIVSGCAASIPAVALVKAVKSASHVDVDLQWSTVAEARDGYNLWRVPAKTDIPSAGAPGNPPVVAVCAPTSATVCVDAGAVNGAGGTTAFYQARAVCGANEGF